MTGWTRLPIRVRLTLAFAAGLAIVLAAFSLFVYVRTEAVTLAAVDAGLRSRAEVVATDIRLDGPSLAHVEPTLIERDEAFAQIVNASGRVVQSSSILSGRRLLPASTLRSLRGDGFFDRAIPGIDNITRVLAVPTRSSRRRVIVLVGASLQDRRDELVQLAATLAAGSTVALGLVSLGAWLVVGEALRPVERMRRQAATISASDSARRLSVSPGRDEIARLGATLNAMLDRIEDSIARERRLVDRASHELRTPLAIQRMDLDLALSGPQVVEELRSALTSVANENDHLTRLAEDLLVVSRARRGELVVNRVKTSLWGLLHEACARNASRAAKAKVDLGVRVSRAAEAWLDPVWLRQALDNLIENALRYTPHGGRIDISAYCTGGMACLIVEDSGSGFPHHVLGEPFEPFSPSSATVRGLGLAVVTSIAAAHEGQVWAENRPEGGARVTIAIQDAPAWLGRSKVSSSG